MSLIFTSQIRSNQPIACSMIEAAVAQGKLAHAYLFTGRSNDDKWQIATQLACYLNCLMENLADKGSCIIQELTTEKYCQNCRWIHNDAHPQAWLKLEGQETKTGRISVEKARILSNELSKTSSFKRVVVIPQAEQDIFHRPSANALLKTIEEPGLNTLFILFANHEEAVLTTIVSRCQIIAVPKSQSFGFWLPSEFEKTEIKTKIALLETSLQQDESNEYDFTSMKSATSTLASTLAWAAKIDKLADDQIPHALILDLIVSAEVSSLKTDAQDNPIVSSHLRKLLKLAESAKYQIEHHVQSKSAIESFALSCRLIF